MREQTAAAAPMHSAVNWALLGLVIERPSYAYELATRFERTYDGAIALSSVSHVYTALGTLRQRGLVREVPGEREATRSRRRYAATEHGIAEHGQWLVGQVSEERRRQHILIVALGALAKDPVRAGAALDAYEQACLQELAAAPRAGSRRRARHHEARRALDRRGGTADERRASAVGSIRASAAQHARRRRASRALACRR